MTTPARQLPSSSGPDREEQAQQAGAAVGAALQAAEASILASLAAAVRSVIAGSSTAQMARRRVRIAITGALGSAMSRANPVIAALPPATQTAIRQAVLNAQASAVRSAAEALNAAAGEPPPGGTGSGPPGGRGSGGSAPPGPGGPGRRRNASELYQDQMDEAKGSKGGPFRDIDDAHRAANVRAMAEKMSRLKQAQKLMDDLASQGITGFTDKAGRNWSLSAYAEMATRTAQSRLIMQNQLKLMGPAGVTLVIVDEPMMEAACPRCRPWVGRVLSLVPFEGGSSSTITDAHGVKRTEEIAGTLAEAVSAGLLHPNCFPAEVLVSAPTGVRAADARWYEGELIVIHAASGDEMPVTPNHPVLTPEGWVAAGDLQVGQHVLRYDLGHQRVDPALPGVGPDGELVPARIGDVFDALRQASPMPAVRMPGAAEQFHGDGGDAYVDVVLADGLLRDYRDAERTGDGLLVGGDAVLAPLAGPGARDQVGVAARHAPDGVMGGGGNGGALCRRHALVAAAVGLAGADLGAALDQPPADAALADVESGRQLGLSLAPAVSRDEIIDIGRRYFAGHVYNLQTGDGWYVANGIVVHNCEHDLTPWHDGTGLAATAGGAQRGYVVAGQPVARSLPNGTPQDYVNRQKLRGHERNVRNAQMGVAAALTPKARRGARADLAGARAALEAHVAATGATRLPGREKAFRSDKAAHPGQPYQAR